jgi:hypothetical protein
VVVIDCTPSMHSNPPADPAFSPSITVTHSLTFFSFFTHFSLRKAGSGWLHSCSKNKLYKYILTIECSCFYRLRKIRSTTKHPTPRIERRRASFVQRGPSLHPNFTLLLLTAHTHPHPHPHLLLPTCTTYIYL